MEIVVRAYVINKDDEILLVKHTGDQPWVLPGGHLDESDNNDIHGCLKREIEEETGLEVTVLGPECQLTEGNVASFPLPISIHKTRYEHRNRGEIEVLEYWFFARTEGSVDQVEDDEIYDYRWVSGDELHEMEANIDVFTSIQEVYNQNIDLLELL